MCVVTLLQWNIDEHCIEGYRSWVGYDLTLADINKLAITPYSKQGLQKFGIFFSKQFVSYTFPYV